MRALWAFRLIFYPTAALTAVLALGARVDAEPEREAWHGRTSQGRPVKLYLVDGQPDVIATSVVVRCPSGHYVDRMAVYVSRPGDRAFHRSETWTQRYDGGWVGHGSTALDARVGDGALRGGARGTQRVTRPGASYSCTSGWVTFTAQR